MTVRGFEEMGIGLVMRRILAGFHSVLEPCPSISLMALSRVQWTPNEWTPMTGTNEPDSLNVVSTKLWM